MQLFFSTPQKLAATVAARPVEWYMLKLSDDFMFFSAFRHCADIWARYCIARDCRKLDAVSRDAVACPNVSQNTGSTMACRSPYIHIRSPERMELGLNA